MEGVRKKHLHQVKHKPRCDALSHNIDEEVGECHAPDVWIFQDILHKELQQRLFLLIPTGILLLQQQQTGLLAGIVFV